MMRRQSPRSLLSALLCLALAACAAPPAEREEALGPHVHRLTVELAGDESAEARLAKDAASVCPTGFDRQEDAAMPSDAPRYRVWLVRCR
jgi:hypothetical protein